MFFLDEDKRRFHKYLIINPMTLNSMLQLLYDVTGKLKGSVRFGKASASLRPRRQTRQLPGYYFMKPTEVIRGYIDAWNGRDAEALVAAFAEDGKFSWNRRRSAR